MNETDFYDLNEKQRKVMLEVSLGNKGKCVKLTGGMCSEIYIFDQGEVVVPRYVCAKIPKKLKILSNETLASRFVNELKVQLSFYDNIFVHWAFDFDEVMGIPVVLSRYWGGDLRDLMTSCKVSDIQKLSIMIYICKGLSHCYKNGLISHQDLKPENIFLRDISNEFRGLPDLDIYNFAMIADFGLANTSVDFGLFDGSRPYMAPEQWNKSDLSSSTDVFATGVILYELMTGGYHPVGIKLEEFWPLPINGNSKKWTRPNPWKKWATSVHGPCVDRSVSIDPKVLQLVQTMLSADPVNRPSIDEVISSLLSIIREQSGECSDQIEFLLNYFNDSVLTEPLEKKWPFLFEKWKAFEVKFGSAYNE